jgi:hypothetical protein
MVYITGKNRTLFRKIRPAGAGMLPVLLLANQLLGYELPARTRREGGLKLIFKI